MNAKETLKRLGELCKTAGGNAYERVKLAALLLADEAYIAAHHKGDDWQAMEFLEEEFFHDLAVPLTDLILVYQRFPAESQWAEHGHKLRKMVQLLKPAPKKRGEVRRVTLKQMEAVEAEKKQLAAMNRTLDKNLQASKSELETLRSRVSQLEWQNTKLKGRIEELERIVEGKLNRKAS